VDDGTWDKTKGKIKEKTGEYTGSSKKQREGEFDQAKGKVKEKVHDVKESDKDRRRD
jgi:uncharacterized protein YjbJ (UPF0337 family)